MARAPAEAVPMGKRAGSAALWIALGAGGFGAAALWTQLTDGGGADGATLEIGSEPIAAQPRPEVLPEPVAATGDCAAAMTGIRALIEEVPSGSMLTEAQNQMLTAGLASVDESCTEGLAGEFREREVLPWLTWAPPAEA